MRVVVVIVALAGCDAVFGLGGRTEDASTVDVPLPCTSPDRIRNPAGCACELVTATSPCYLGDPGSPEQPSACSVAGQTVCGNDHVWSTCEGASMPSPEVCFDSVDNDCNGETDEGCTCADAANVCIDPATEAAYANDVALGAPMPIRLGFAFQIIGVSRTPMPGAVISTRNATCSGAMQVCNVGGACTGWHVSMLELTAVAPWFLQQGTFPIAVRVQDEGACASAQRIINGTVTVVP